MDTLFRIGGVYRQRNGDLVKLFATCCDHWPDAFHAQSLDGLGQGHRFVSMGAERDSSMLHYNRDLLPGELHKVDGQWVPLEDKPAKSIGALLREQQSASPKLTSETDPRLAEIARDMRKRDPLPYREEERKRAEFDRFAGFTVTSGGMTQPQPTGHALQRLGDASDPLHGSALIQPKKA